MSKPNGTRARRGKLKAPFLQRRYLMFDKLNQLAEQAAMSVSRRQFLGRFGRAAALAAAAGALLAQQAFAARPIKRCDSYFSDGACMNQYVGAFCGYRSKCVAIADLGEGLYACSCQSKGRHGP